MGTEVNSEVGSGGSERGKGGRKRGRGRKEEEEGIASLGVGWGGRWGSFIVVDLALPSRLLKGATLESRVSSLS